jgi:alkaline phosphatase
VGFIEADIFLNNDKLLVAHTASEIRNDKTLETLYFVPLQNEFLKNKGFAYADHGKSLTLMIDLKTDGVKTLTKLAEKIRKYPALLSCKNFQITVSGNVPDPKRWNEFPDFIHFDGRPGIAYTKEQLARISLISTSFGDHSKWNGKGVPVKSDFNKIISLRDGVHANGKKLRFWGAPDFANAWLVMMSLKIDILGTDDVQGLAAFLKSSPGNSFQNETTHDVYQPAFKTTAKAPKNIILMIGDGMGLTQLYSGYTANQGHLNIFNIRDIGFSVTVASDSYITDSAAGATAMATGKKTNNRFISVDSVGKVLPAITEQLRVKKYKTAIISNGDITDATPAAFYAHQPERDLSEAIANDFLASKSDILIGGGLQSFIKRKDGKNILSILKQDGYTVSEKFSALDTIKNNRFVLLDDSSVVSKIHGRKDFLSRSLNKALGTLSATGSPFFVMAEGAQIDWGGHENNIEYVVREVLDFDQAIGEAMKFVDRNPETLLIITADHETGGLSLLGGDLSRGYVRGSFSTTDHTAVMVPVFSYGAGSEMFRGVYQNTMLNIKIKTLLGVTD